jgi:hypothetical protein
MNAEQEFETNEDQINITIELDDNNDLIVKLTGFRNDDIRDRVANNINEHLEEIAMLAFNTETDEFVMGIEDLSRQPRTLH